MAIWNPSNTTSPTQGPAPYDASLGGGSGYYDWLNTEGGGQTGEATTPEPTGGGGTAQQPQPGASQTPVTATGQISPSYSGSPSNYYGQDFQQGQQGTARTGAAASNTSDYAVADAYETIARAYRDILGREASSEEIWSQIRAQGWKPGDRWVGSQGLNAILNSMRNSPEAQARTQQPPPVEQPPPAGGPPAPDPGPEETFIEGDPYAPAPGAGAPAEPPAAGGGGTGGGTGGGGGDWTEAINKIASQFSTYDPYQFSQYQAPDQSAYTNQVQSALSQALANSEWSPERIAGMKEVQKEQALQMQRQTGQQMGDILSARGRGQGGMALANQRRLADATQGQILGSYRDINEQAAQNRRQELLSTAAALEQALTGQVGRATQNYATGLAGQGAQADENFRGWESQFTPYELGLKQKLGEEGIGVDWGKISEGGRQFDLAHELAKMEFQERIRQFNAGLGYDYGALNAGLIKPFMS